MPPDSTSDVEASPEWLEGLHALNQVIADSGDALEGNLCYEHRDPEFLDSPPDPRLRTKRDRFRQVVTRRSNLLELGVNGGHSAYIALTANPELVYHGVDICSHAYVRPVIAWLQSQFPGRVSFTAGDTLRVLPALRRQGLRFDSFHVDGAKFTYFGDILHAQQMTESDRAVAIVDDTNGPLVADTWRRCLRRGLVVPLEEFPPQSARTFSNGVGQLGPAPPIRTEIYLAEAAGRRSAWKIGQAARRYRRRVVKAAPPRTDSGPRPDLGAQLNVVIVAYGPTEYLARCLTTLGPELAVTVVDNGSSTVAAKIAEEAGARYVDPGDNLGFAAGVNLALSHLADPRGDVLLVNPDAEVSPDAVKELHRAMRANSSLACVAPVLLDSTGDHPVRCVWPFPTPGRAWLDALGLGRLVPQSGTLIGAVLMLAGDALAEVGGFDERFFLYSEETDWQRRAIDLGWQVRLLDEATARHAGAGTGGDRDWREAAFLASVERYIRKWHGQLGWTSFRMAAGLAAGRRTMERDPVLRAAARRRLAIYVEGPQRVARRLRVPLKELPASEPTPSLR